MGEDGGEEDPTRLLFRVPDDFGALLTRKVGVGFAVLGSSGKLVGYIISTTHRNDNNGWN